MHVKPMMNDNKSELGNRLRQEMKKHGISSAELARQADVKTSFLYDVISGKSANPSSIKLARVAESLGISLTYLAGTSDSPQSGYQFSIPAAQREYIALAHIMVKSGTVSSELQKPEPYQFHSEWLTKSFKTQPDDLRAFTVEGDQMSPSLQRGDVVLIDLSKKDPSPPGMFLVLEGGGLAVKRLEIIGKPAQTTLRVSCDNQSYTSYESDLDDVDILGRLIWFSRSI